MEMYAIQSKQASMSSGCIVANPDITLIRLTNQGPRFIGGRGIFRFAVTHDPYWGLQRFTAPNRTSGRCCDINHAEDKLDRRIAVRQWILGLQ
jgi:hypothetical protein